MKPPGDKEGLNGPSGSPLNSDEVTGHKALNSDEVTLNSSYCPDYPERTMGVFDSGYGGMSVIRELLKENNGRDLCYLADQQHAPYGSCSLETIRHWSERISEFFISRGIQVIVIACNSASAAALYFLRGKHPSTSFVGMEPAVKPAVSRSKAGRIGVLATSATLAGTPYKKVLERYAEGKTIIECACPDWVELVESGLTSVASARETVGDTLAPLLEHGVDQLVLGCTHFSFLKHVIDEVTGGTVEVIDPSSAVARQAIRIADAAQVDRGQGKGTCHLLTTGDSEAFAETVEGLLKQTFPVTPAQWEQN